LIWGQSRHAAAGPEGIPLLCEGAKLGCDIAAETDIEARRHDLTEIKTLPLFGAKNV
jgi:hypothetical protein